MATITEILDDLRAAHEIIRRYERRYWLSSEDFHRLYTQGLLDDGEHLEDLTEWAAFYKLKLRREDALQQISRRRVEALRRAEQGDAVKLDRPEPEFTPGVNFSTSSA
jgi:hypothetical protein